MIIALLLLTSCSGAGRQREAEDLALTIRGEYLALENLSAEVDITADYGERVYEFALTASVQDGEMVLTLTEPEWVAGVEDATTACMPVTCTAVALRRIRHVVPRIFRQSYLLTKLYKSSMIRSTENIEVDYLKVIDFQ